MPALQPHPFLMLAVLIGGGTPLVVAASYLFFLVCERPFLRRRIVTPKSMVAKTAVEAAP